MKEILYGNVVITGKPNVGKSTLFNKLLNSNLAIVSKKPQTTRNKIVYTYRDNNSFINLYDTPGYHEPNFKIDLFLNSEIKSSYKNADVVLLLVDANLEQNEEDEEIIKLLISYKINNIILVFTKSDITLSNSVKKREEYLKAKLPNINKTLSISSKTNKGINELMDSIKLFLTKISDNNLPSEVTIDDNFLITEIVREQILKNTNQEIPHASGVFLDNKSFENNLFTINLLIVVEKESQKPIIIGKGGSMLKKINSGAMVELKKMYACKIRLSLYVKVVKDWRNNIEFLKNNGYFH